ncbi:MAG: septation protein A [Thiotrichaceae bacterium]
MKFLFDFLPVVLFFAAYKLFGSVPPELIQAVNQIPYVDLSQSEPRDSLIFATLVLLIASVVQNVLHWLVYKRFEKMHLISMAILLVFGSMTIAFKDPDFIKWKVSIFNWVFAVAMLGSLFIGKKTLIERMMSQAISVPKKTWNTVTVMWALFFGFIGILNLVVAFYYPGENDKNWVNFKLFGIFGLTIVFMIAQAMYLSRYATDDGTNEDLKSKEM